MAKQAPQKRKNRNLLAGTILVALLLVVVVQLFRMQEQLAAAQNDLESVAGQIDELEQSNAALRSDLDKAESEAFLADLAREQFDLVTPNEKVFYDSGN